jgi:arabinogalactan oligomer/maltooligosaccharide transport system permease protein
MRFFTSIAKSIRANWNGAVAVIKGGNSKTASSMLFMGLGQLRYRQWLKGFAYLVAQTLAVCYFILRGARDIVGFFTLGTVKGDIWQGIVGDNSVTMLIMGIFAFIVLIVYFALYISNIKDVYATQKRAEAGKAPETSKEVLNALIDKKFHKTALTVPILGVAVFSVLPIVFMVLIAFTNYGGDIVPPELVGWTGFESFRKVLTLGQFSSTFGKILFWNILWAVLSTFLNYFGGLALALLYNKKCVKGKAFWRAFAILAYAIPGFITLLAFKFMFSYGGPINQMITDGGGTAVGFLDLDAKWTARVIGLFVNAWISIPTTMLLATGILSNMKQDLYEAARIDGATPFKQFIKLTLPFVLFATTPVLIAQFIGNFNNFGIFYFLRGGLYIDGYFLASDTDLLINWLYNLSIDNNYYSIGAAISLIIFIITSVISLVVYVLSPAYKQEDQFR